MAEKKTSFWRRRRRRERPEVPPDAGLAEVHPTETAGAEGSPRSVDLPDVPAFASLRGAETEAQEPAPPSVEISEAREDHGSSTQIEIPAELSEESDLEDEDAPVLFGVLPPQISDEHPLGPRLDVVAAGEEGRLAAATSAVPGDEETLLTAPADTEVSAYLQESLGSLETDAVDEAEQPEPSTSGVGWRDEPEQWDSEEEAWKEITSEWAREDSSEEEAVGEGVHEPRAREPAEAEPEASGEGLQLQDETAPPHVSDVPDASDQAIPAEPFPEEFIASGDAKAEDEEGDFPSAAEVAEVPEPSEATVAPAVEPGVSPIGETPDSGASGEVAAAEAPALEAAPRAEKKRSLPVAVITGIVFAAVALGLLLAGPTYFALLAFGLVVVAEVEFVNAVRKSGFQPAAVVILLGTLLAFVAAAKQGAIGVAFSLAMVVVAASLWYTAGIIKTSPIANLASTVFGFSYVGFTGALAVTVMGFPDPQPNWRAIITFPLAVAIATDVGGYLGGRRWGKHFVVRSISPRKSIEGYVGGLVLAMAVAAGFFVAGRLLERSFSYWTLPKAAGGCAVVFAASILGDLLESLLKRSLGIKDMSSILPGHGGMLDRIDSLLVAVPAFAGFLYFAGF